MNLLTKEQCNEALEHIKTLRGSNYGGYYSGFNNSALPFDEDINVMQELMHEYFDNPPLKFDELQEREIYYHVYYGWISIRSISDCECILINTLNSDGYKQIEFEEDCFYRKEVQND